MRSRQTCVFFYYFLRVIFSLVHFLSLIFRFLLSVPPIYFIFPTCINFSHLSPYFFPSIFYSSELVRASIPFSFLPVFLCSFLSILSIDHIFIHLFINFKLFLASFLPSFILHLLFPYFVHSYFPIYLRS